MKKFLLYLLLAASCLAQQNVRQDITTKRIQDNLNFGSGKILDMEPGSTLDVTGATLTGFPGGGVWGSITGTLSNQTDLQAALNLLAPLASPTFTGTAKFPQAGGIGLFDTDSSHVMRFRTSNNLTGDRTIFFNTNDVDRTILFNGNLTASGTTSGTNTGDQTITLTGDISGTGAGSFATTLPVVNANVGTFAVQTVNAKGQVTAAANMTGEVTTTNGAATLTNSAVIGKVLTGYVSGAGTVAATDTLLAAIQKLNGNDATNANLTGEVTSVGNATTLTNAAAIGKVLTGYVSGAGTVAATDTILQAIQKLNGNDATNANLTGDVTSVGNATTITTVNSNVGTFVVQTVNAKGQVTAAANMTGDVTTLNGAATLATVNSNVGSFTSANITVNAKGQITAAASGSPGSGGTGSITFILDGQGVALTTGTKKATVRMPTSGVITKATLLSDVSGSVVVDIWKDTYANYPPTIADTITASAKPTLSSATKSEDATLTGWTTALSAGDVLKINVDSASTLTFLTLTLTYTY